MLTTSELAVTATIWILTAAGGFFGTRAVLRKKKLKFEETKSNCSKPASEIKNHQPGTGESSS